jgi:hypothetical protein
MIIIYTAKANDMYILYITNNQQHNSALQQDPVKPNTNNQQ